MVACLVRDPLDGARGRPIGESDDLLDAIARACSPRVEPHGPDAVLFDADGLSRVCGPPDVIAHEVTALAASQSLSVRVALAGTRTAAWILAHARPGHTVVAPGKERDALASLPAGWLGCVEELDQVRSTKYEVRSTAGTLPTDNQRLAEPPSFKRGSKHAGGGGHHYRLAPGPGAAQRARVPRAQSREPNAEGYADVLSIFARWGLRTCADVSALPRADVRARLGPLGVRLHQAACGEDVEPLVPVDDVVPFADRMELEWPIDGLEPLSFVLSRQFDRLAAVLEQADRGAVTVTTRLRLTTKDVHERVLNLPAPMREARVLRTLVLLDLESHPPAAGIDVVEIILGVTPGRIVQGSLLTRSLPSPEDIATLIARLGALMGESRIGAPVLLDTHDTRPVAMRPFRIGRPTTNGQRLTAGTLNLEPGTGSSCAFRRFSLPLSVRVTVERGVPTHVSCAARALSGDVIRSAGPWRTSGEWWVLEQGGWDRDEWDVQLADGVVYRLARHRATGAWDINGIFD